MAAGAPGRRQPNRHCDNFHAGCRVSSGQRPRRDRANALSGTLIPIIREKIKPDSIILSESFRNSDLLDV
jgi:hypothetical protein